MSKNYYKNLGISATATLEEIKQGYRRAVLSWHPSKTKSDKSDAAQKFKEASEAYEVLSKPESRSIYDMFGYDALVNGVYDETKILFPAFQFTQDSQKVYQNFILEANPFVNIIDFDGRSQQGSMFGYAAFGLNWQPNVKPEDIEITVDCTLEEIFLGCQKEIRYICNLFNDDHRTTFQKEMAKTIIVKPGYNKDTVLRFENEGSEKMNCKRGDLVVKISELKHKLYERRMNDLHYRVKVNLLEAISACAIRVETLDKRVLMLSVDECLNPDKTITLTGQGMPVYSTNDEPLQNGNFIVHFDLEMPIKVPQHRQEALRTILPIS